MVQSAGTQFDEIRRETVLARLPAALASSVEILCEAMVCHKRLLLLLSLGAALFLVVVQLAPDLGLPAVRAPPVSSVNSLLTKLSTSDTLRPGRDVEGTSSPGGVGRRALEQNNPAFLQASIAKVSTTKKALSRITPAGVLRPKS
ncbi:hypothetical protein HPB51_023824 [Rhipicephalus microplus]|uniref:Uncharacterized protein n=1 Tax=Rhipicephalus microplus TaxID=6941 RepID=A0A9J6EDM9_RHIMP|nr:hypothetical protein HPB51_023824 [Rhipicephalus microplus]